MISSRVPMTETSISLALSAKFILLSINSSASLLKIPFKLLYCSSHNFNFSSTSDNYSVIESFNELPD